MQKRIIIVLLSTAFLMCGMALTSDQVYAQSAPAETEGFGAVSVTPRQTIRINVSNIYLPRNGEIPPGPCRVELQFVNERGDSELKPSVLSQPGKQLTWIILRTSEPEGHRFAPSFFFAGHREKFRRARVFRQSKSSTAPTEVQVFSIPGQHATSKK